MKKVFYEKPSMMEVNVRKESSFIACSNGSNGDAPIIGGDGGGSNNPD